MPSRTDSPAALLPSLPEGARVLVIRLRSLGDSLLLTPALQALKQWRPDLRISVLLYQRFAPILEGNPDVDELLPLDPEGPAATISIAQMTARLRERRFAACFNLHGGTLSAWLAWTSGASHRVGWRRFRFGFVYTAVAPDPHSVLGRTRVHSVEDQLSLFQWAGLPPGPIGPLRIFPQAAARAAVAEKLARAGLSHGSRYAVLHPVSRIITQDWPAESYAAVARALEEEHNLVPVVHCGPGEGAKLEAIARFHSRPLVRVEELNIPELVALIEGAALFVGVDSGPAHIAAALARPVVVLFGSMDSAVWGPWRSEHQIVQNYYSCNPCRGDRCYAFERPECILSITPAQVRAAIQKLLAPAKSERVVLPTRAG
ncbi:MAG: glycosyltransferase family 9 protein [Candidatus Acidiferrales bacterium]